MAVVIFAGLTVMISYHEMLHNALLLPAAGMTGAARASGLALAGGNAFSVLMLVGVLVAFALPGKVHWGWLPAAPLLGLDRALGEPERIVPVIVAVTLALGSLLLFFRVPDMRRDGAVARPGDSGWCGRSGRAVSRRARQRQSAALSCWARMIYTDGLRRRS